MSEATEISHLISSQCLVLTCNRCGTEIDGQAAYVIARDAHGAGWRVCVGCLNVLCGVCRPHHQCRPRTEDVT